MCGSEGVGTAPRNDWWGGFEVAAVVDVGLLTVLRRRILDQPQVKSPLSSPDVLNHTLGATS